MCGMRLVSKYCSNGMIVFLFLGSCCFLFSFHCVVTCPIAKNCFKTVQKLHHFAWIRFFWFEIVSFEVRLYIFPVGDGVPTLARLDLHRKFEVIKNRGGRFCCNFFEKIQRFADACYNLIAENTSCEQKIRDWFESAPKGWRRWCQSRTAIKAQLWALKFIGKKWKKNQHQWLKKQHDTRWAPSN